MERLRFDAFLDSLDEIEKEDINSTALDKMDSFPSETFVDFSERPEVQAILLSYERFIQESSQRSSTFAFWSMYIRMAGEV